MKFLATVVSYFFQRRVAGLGERLRWKRAKKILESCKQSSNLSLKISFFVADIAYLWHPKHWSQILILQISDFFTLRNREILIRTEEDGTLTHAIYLLWLFYLFHFFFARERATNLLPEFESHFIGCRLFLTQWQTTELVALLKFLYSFLRSQNASFFSNEVLHFLVTYGKKAIEF